MPTPFESAQLALRLYELRRDPVLREARNWWLFEFHPDSADEIVAAFLGADHHKFRAVVGYWDVAAALVLHGAIDPAIFFDTNPEMLGFYSKVAPYLAAVRERMQRPQYLANVERVVAQWPGAEERMAVLRRSLHARVGKT